MSSLSQMSSLSTCISKALSPAAVRIVRAEWHQTLVAVSLRFVGRRSFTAGWFIRLYHGKNRQFCNRVRAGRIFFLTLCPKNLSLYEIHSAPTLVFSKFRVVVPLKNIQRHWGCNQRKVWSKTHCLTDLGPGTLSRCRCFCPAWCKIKSSAKARFCFHQKTQ